MQQVCQRRFWVSPVRPNFAKWNIRCAEACIRKVTCKTRSLKILSHVTRKAMPSPWSGALLMPLKSTLWGYPRQGKLLWKMEANSADAAHQPLCSRHSHADRTPFSGHQVALPPHTRGHQPGNSLSPAQSIAATAPCRSPCAVPQGYKHNAPPRWCPRGRSME